MLQVMRPPFGFAHIYTIAPPSLLHHTGNSGAVAANYPRSRGIASVDGLDSGKVALLLLSVDSVGGGKRPKKRVRTHRAADAAASLGLAPRLFCGRRINSTAQIGQNDLPDKNLVFGLTQFNVPYKLL